MSKSDSEKSWYEEGIMKGWIGTYEREMIRFLEQEVGSQPDDVKLCMVFTSLFVNAGHVCLPLDRSPKEWVNLLDLEINHPAILSKQEVDTSALEVSPLVGTDVNAPFIFEKNRLFISRYWWYEFIVAQKLKEFTSNESEKILNKKTEALVATLFPQGESGETDWQKIAAALALFKNFVLISGGPGTGKTTTVGKILALLLQTSEEPLRVALAAPTGKAAARMGEAVTSLMAGLSLPGEILRLIPKEAKTLHRLLWGMDHSGLLPPAEKKFLPYDLVIIDEASMIDLMLMNRLLSHLRPGTRLILLGDKDQLASVEAGAVLADMCKKERNGFSPGTAGLLDRFGIENLPVHEQSALDDSVIYLEKSWRFDKGSGIGSLADKIKTATTGQRPGKNGRPKGSSAAVQPDLFSTPEMESGFDTLFFNGYSDLNYHQFRYQKEDLRLLFDNISERLNQFRGDEQPGSIYGVWQREIWLSVLRHSPFGSKRLNWLIENDLAHRGFIQPVQGWYHGRPVLVTRNDYSLGVFNGDVGVCTLDEKNTAWIHFPDKEDFRRIRAARLTHAEPAYVLTVHKSQGSEFDHVNLLLPQKDTPILTKELIYTAITRARKTFSLYGEMDLFEKGAARKTERFTGLRDKLM